MFFFYQIKWTWFRADYEKCPEQENLCECVDKLLAKKAEIKACVQLSKHNYLLPRHAVQCLENMNNTLRNTCYGYYHVKLSLENTLKEIMKYVKLQISLHILYIASSQEAFQII